MKNSMSALFKCCLLTCCLLADLAYAQTPVTSLTGRVLDAKTGQTLPLVPVYINNTSRGTTADENGVYQLTNVPLGSQELVASLLGYQTIRQPLRLTDTRPRTIDLTLNPTGQALAAVTVTGRHSKVWERQFRQFSRELLGSRPQARQCRISNPECAFLSGGERPLAAHRPLSRWSSKMRLWVTGCTTICCILMLYRNRMDFAGTARFEELIDHRCPTAGSMAG